MNTPVETNQIVTQFINTLKYLEIDTVFGIVGIPIVTLANDMIKNGIKFVSFRNEQAASYAASAYGYLTGKPGILLTVGGPGLIHAMSGIYNSINNRWPMIVISGSNGNSNDQYKGAFQELDQISLLNKYVKFCGRLNPENIQQLLFQCYNLSIQGTLGVTYLDFPGNLIEDLSIGSNDLRSNQRLQTNLPPIPKRIKYCPDPHIVKNVCKLLLEHRDKEILVVVGKGSQPAFKEMNQFINIFQLPFLPTPMGKGVVSDLNPLNVSSARSLVMKRATLVLVFGARLNWILHYGESPRWNSDAIFVQCDHTPETLGHNNIAGLQYSLCGDINLTLKELIFELTRLNFKYHGIKKEIKDKIKSNEQRLTDLEVSACRALYNAEGKMEMNYHSVYRTIRELMDLTNTFLVTEGANTMDKARISFPCLKPKSRLDAGTNATMGVGLGYSIAAKLYSKEKDVVLIQGDSAFGFSGMELETITRSKLGIVIVIMNNSGIYHGCGSESATKLSEHCRYDLVAKGLGSKGYLITTLDELKVGFRKALVDSRTKRVTTLLNVIISHGNNKTVRFAWQNKPNAKL
ncbi:putative indolepyruvate decarboxylase family protein PWA37_000007 [Arxiozyma heterogenica]|uniref:putative indolepyruvate decarboxylase family protein n=1 Tax=Arxiozyma heterogenica TaxID=278026 RepID=UPI002F1C540B